MTAPVKRKLIEVALPLEAISRASAVEKAIRGGHPANLHPWWARRPLAACRAVVFASLVDDPSSDPDRFPSQKAILDERARLFGIIDELVRWENSGQVEILDKARAEVMRSTEGNPPPVFDPFCGGGSIPLEAQRLGLSAYASDLNPVAVLITRALIEIPARFANRPPVHPDARQGVGGSGTWSGASGLAEDVQRYGEWMREEAQRRVGHLYPKARLPEEHGGGEANVVAWLWARTVTCPNPACGASMPLARSFELSKKKGREAWAVPVVDPTSRTVSFVVGGPRGMPPAGTVGRHGARCVVCDSAVPLDYIRAEGKAKRMAAQLMTIAADGGRGRIYLAPDPEHVRIAASATPSWGPEDQLQGKLTANAYLYGLTRFRDLFTPRQLVVLTTFSDLVGELRTRVRDDAVAAGLVDDEVPLHAGGNGPTAYGDAVATYLGMLTDKLTELNVTVALWKLDRECTVRAFGRQALPMTWDYPESNPFGESAGSWRSAMSLYARSFDAVCMPANVPAVVEQRDAREGVCPGSPLVVTDPPYYDNIAYADLSDFYYTWLRRSLHSVWPDLLGTLLTPKSDELTAAPNRFGGSRTLAGNHFESGLQTVFEKLRSTANPDYPVAIFYAFKQAESLAAEQAGTTRIASTGWETMLEGLLRAGYEICGTWPIRTELTVALKTETNTLTSSIVLVCRPRHVDAGITTRKGFVANLKSEMPEALRTLQHGSIAPVDLAQSSIGPGMAIFSRYAKVLEPDGSAMGVRTALALINQVLDELLTEQEGEFDADTRWAIAWYEQFGLSEAAYGMAETLSKAKNSSVAGLVEAGIVAASRGRVRLLAREEYSTDWDPAKDRRTPVWEATQRLVHALLSDGEASAGDLLARLGGLGDTARDLAYRMYHVAERKGWTDEARAYNALVVAWTDLARGAESVRTAHPAQTSLGLE